MNISAEQLIAAFCNGGQAQRPLAQWWVHQLNSWLLQSAKADKHSALLRSDEYISWSADCCRQRLRLAGDFSDEYISGLLDISADLSLSADPPQTVQKKHANLCFDSFFWNSSYWWHTAEVCLCYFFIYTLKKADKVLEKIVIFHSVSP